MIGLQTAVNDANEEAVAEGEGEGGDKDGGSGDSSSKGGGTAAGLRSGSLGDLDVLEVSALDEVSFAVAKVNGGGMYM